MFVQVRFCKLLQGGNNGNINYFKWLWPVKELWYMTQYLKSFMQSMLDPELILLGDDYNGNIAE